MTTLSPPTPFIIYLKSILSWLAFTCIVGYLQMTYTFELKPLKPLYFIAPGVIGVLFGIMTARIISLNQQLKLFSIRDPLTNAYNHRHYKQILNDWIAEKAVFSIIIIDIDFFKKINDQHGHQIGDNVLIELSKLITDIKRPYDIFARHGGEEFILLTPRTELTEASQIAQRLCTEVKQASMPNGIPLTCSFGVSQFRRDTDTADSLFIRADKALYQSKNNGRNRVTSENEAC